MKSKLKYFFYSAFMLILLGCPNDHRKSSFNFLVEPGPILFISSSQLYSMSEDGGNIQQLTDDQDFPIGYARWSPDGQKIALVSEVGGVDFYGPAIYIVNADGSGFARLTKADNGQPFNYDTGWNPRWSPDSKKIAFNRIMIPEGASNADIFTIEPDGSNETQITDSSLHETPQDWSPSGDSMLVRRDYNLHINNSIIGTTALFTMTLDGKYHTIISDTNSQAGSGLWNKNNIIVYSDGKDFQGSLHTFDLNTGQTQLVQTPGSYFSFVPIDWSADADSLLFGAYGDFVNGDYRVNVYMKDMNSGEIRDITPPFQINFAVSWRKH